MAIARPLKPGRATAELKSNLIRSLEFGTAVARRLKRTSEAQAERFVQDEVNREALHI